MKKQIALSIIAIAFAGSAFAQLSGDVSTRPVSFYVEPSVFWVPSNNGLDDGFGGAISSGAIFHKHHQVGLDFAYFEADYDKGPGKMKFMPLTTSYQYLIPFGKCFQARAGVHAGAMFEKSEDQPGIRNKSRTAFTGGASLGLDWVINKNVSVGVGGKWMYVDETNDLRERNMALVGLNCAMKF